MGDILSYKQAVIDSMGYLGEDERTIFIGQGVLYPGLIFDTLIKVPKEKRLEVPVFEDTQLGICIGLSLEGYIPVCIFPRMDFLMCAMNQLVNHLDKIEYMSSNRFSPKVIIRTLVGATYPLDPGPQHCHDYTLTLQEAVENIVVVQPPNPEILLILYKEALREKGSYIIIEDMLRERNA